MQNRERIFLFFPVSDTEVRMTSCGLKWELDNLVWKSGDAGISNTAVETVLLLR